MKFSRMKLIGIILIAIILTFNLGFTSAQDKVEAVNLNYHTPQSIDDFQKLQAQIIKTVEKVRTSVVGVQIGGGSGSGTFISDDGWVLTAAHVTRWRANVPCRIVMHDGTSLKAVSKGFNRQLDFALIKAEVPKETKLTVAKLGDSDDVKVGRWVVSMGHPLGFKTNPVRPPVVRTGRVIRIHSMIVSDAPLISGDSGGPMFDLDGNVLGVNVSISIRDVKVNNTTKVNPVKVQMENLKKGESLSGTGPSVSGYDNGIEGAYKTLDAAAKDKNAETFLKAEKEFQEVIQLDVKRAEGYYHLVCCYSRWMNILESEEKIKMQTKALDGLQVAFDKGWRDFTHMYRDTDMNNIKNTDRYKNLLSKFRGGPYFGFTIKDLEDADKKNLEIDGGLMVTEVAKDDPADLAGILINDVILSINDKEIKDKIQLRNYLPRLKADQEVKIIVLRNKEKVELTMKLGGVPRRGGVASTTFSKLTYKEGSKLREVWKQVVIDNKLNESIVRINTTSGKLLGYGVVVGADGLILTKFSQYAIDKTGKYNKMNYPKIIVEMADGKKFSPTQVNESRKLDISLLRINAKGLTPVKWGSSKTYKIGEFVTAIATKDIPIGLGIISLFKYESNVGAQQAVIGIMPSKDLDDLKKFGIEYEKGILIGSITPNSGASDAKLRPGDIIVDIDDEGIDTTTKLRAYITKLEPGRRIWVEVFRSGVEGTFTKVIKLTSRGSTGRASSGRYNAIAGPKNQIAEGFGEVIQHDIALRPEYTGSLLVNLKGEIIGMNISRVERTRSYALPADVLKEVVSLLIEEKRDIPTKDKVDEEKKKELVEEDF
ncbi:MAG: trypsin-like peptidase domain-containing protein [Planctomycetes bacterium]|nr:trypsin-like peptidase domain-containing protein [Planctomycetota bacterium]